jgi:hypothetical protein
MSVDRRHFLRGLAGLFGAAVTFPDLQARVLDAGQPVLLQPSTVADTIYVSEWGGLFLGDATINTCVRPTWRQYFSDRGCHTPAQFERQRIEWYVADLDMPVSDASWPSIYETRYAPAPAAYHLLRRLKVGTGLRSKARVAGRLDFFAGSNHPGSVDLAVQAADDLSVSLLQANLIERGQPIRVVMEAPTIIKPDEFHADGEPADE